MHLTESHALHSCEGIISGYFAVSRVQKRKIIIGVWNTSSTNVSTVELLNVATTRLYDLGPSYFEYRNLVLKYFVS
jgi:hypothetical protein